MASLACLPQFKVIFPTILADIFPSALGLSALRRDRDALLSPLGIPCVRAVHEGPIKSVPTLISLLKTTTTAYCVQEVQAGRHKWSDLRRAPQLPLCPLTLKTDPLLTFRGPVSQSGAGWFPEVQGKAGPSGLHPSKKVSYRVPVL